jgi:EAL domain-containing protein (putative c-di-GMP-specific phosphodiesterase class I)
VREVLKNGELRLYFQPQFNNLTNEIVGFEGLLRWENPKYKFWSPTDFFEVMSENKLVIDVGKLVLEETLRFAQEVAPPWHSGGLQSLSFPIVA